MSSMVPLGIATISAFMKEHGIETMVFDTTFYETGQNANTSKVNIGQVQGFDFSERGIHVDGTDIFLDFRETIIEYKPDLIAVSMVEDVFYLGINLLRSIEDLKIPNIVGGVFPTFAPEKVIAEQCVDMVCVGEGEEVLLDLCKALQNGRSLNGIPNLWCKSSNGITKAPLRPVINMDNLPVPDYDIFPEKLLYRPMQGKVRLTIGVETQRGCHFTCTFCNSPSKKTLYRKFGSNFYRRKPVSMIKHELSLLVDKYKPEFVYWVADNFMAMPESEWIELYKMYMNFRIPFWMNTRAETITRKRIEQLEEMNCMRCNIGIEHGNYNFRKNVIKRKTKDEELIEGCKAFENTSITVVANTIIGYPGETEALIRESIAFNRKVAPYIDSTSAFIFAPYHGTPLRDKAIKEGYITDDVIVNVGTTTGSILKMPNLTNEKLRGLQRTFPLYVKLPKKNYADIRRCETFDDEANAIFNNLLKIYQERFLDKKKGNDWVDLH